MNDPLLVYPDPPPLELVRTLDLGNWNWKAIGNAQEPEGRWVGAVVVVDDDTEDAFGFCRTLKRRGLDIPVLLLVSGNLLEELEMRDDLFVDFCLTPFHQRELDARLSHLAWRSGTGLRPELIEYGPLVLNVETYQASISGKPLDLTYMEYELLKFLANSPGKVFTRETLLSRVWGYDYFGGARTVDVHVRRLRAKLGEENAGLLTTVRSVGYRFGLSRWEH
ncbi:MAG: response regulator transcription factor [Acidimicrobiia bacterium]|nr:response regulator transcription factor [Acidimicrobiia bacterium]MYC58268.1 response regulator transcription factor [Acidimicrobiia bacterium]MYG93956.1 response regulator transcription factor [Acidimicrobiia bacterium]MYI30974.1 response regulator transcription factor [Acidimicrobiia bacterium]